MSKRARTKFSYSRELEMLRSGLREEGINPDEILGRESRRKTSKSKKPTGSKMERTKPAQLKKLIEYSKISDKALGL